jgi:hypothetical protein
MHMSSRTAKFVSAVFASFLVGTPVATVPHSAARAADDCLAAPKKDQTPQGSHWYYRVDHATKRNCWYLREEGERLSQATEPKRPPSVQPASPKPETTMQPSIADAHAELPPQTPFDTPIRDGAFAAAMPAPAIRENSAVFGAETARSIVASRWPDSPTAPPPPASDPAPNKRDVVASADPTPQAQPALQPTGRLAAADVSSQTSIYSVPLLAAALMAALALAGVIASVIFRLGRNRQPARAKIRRHRGARWETTDDDSIVLSDPPAADVVPRRRGFARDLDQAGDRGERVTEFFAQLSKRS